jgi:hypothetical protein
MAGCGGDLSLIALGAEKQASTSDKKSLCTDADRQAKMQHCLEELGLDEASCSLKVDAWCSGEGDKDTDKKAEGCTDEVRSEKHQWCLENLDLDEARCTEKVGGWCG